MPRFTRRERAAAILLAAATFIAYHPAWRGGVLWDDNAHLTRPDLQSLTGLWRIWFDVGATQQYYPATHSAFWLMHRLWGDAVLGYHLVNIALHIASALLVACLLKRLAVPGALLAAAIFALHPVHVESVAWMTELKNTLSSVCVLAAALAYLRFDGNRRAVSYVTAMALFVAALLAKSVTALLPAALVIVFWWQRGSILWRRDVRPLVPFFALGAAAGLTTSWFERALNGARGIEFHLGALERVLIAGRAICFYATKLVWPAGLSFIYPRWNVDAGAWQSYAYPIAVAVAFALCWYWRTTTRAPLAALSLFCATLVPALGFFDIYPFRYSFVADHFQYLASIPLIALASASLVTAAATKAAPRAAEAVIAAALSIPLAALTWNQSRQYADEATLYSATLATNPGCWLCHENIATPKLHGSQADLDDAIAHLQAALRIYPNAAETHNNLGGAWQRMGRYEEAIREHEEALRLNPNLVEARYNIGLCQQALGRLDEARAQYAQAVREQPDYTMARYNLATTLAASGQFAEAETQFREALRQVPELAVAHDGLGFVLLQTGRIPDAVTEFKTATRIRPDYAPAHFNLAMTLAGAGLREEALEEFREAARYAPDSPQMHQALGAALADAGMYVEAEREFREALRLKPGDPQARTSLERLGRIAR